MPLENFAQAGVQQLQASQAESKQMLLDGLYLVRLMDTLCTEDCLLLGARQNLHIVHVSLCDATCPGIPGYFAPG